VDEVRHARHDVEPGGAAPDRRVAPTRGDLVVRAPDSRDIALPRGYGSGGAGDLLVSGGTRSTGVTLGAGRSSVTLGALGTLQRVERLRRELGDVDRAVGDLCVRYGAVPNLLGHHRAVFE